MIIFDPSRSMIESYLDRPKFDYAKDLVTCLNKTIPNLGYKGGIRTFGNPVYTSLIHGIKPYDKKEFHTALRTILKADGASPMAFAIEAMSTDWKKFAIEKNTDKSTSALAKLGKIAAIIISDGNDMDLKPVLTTEKIKETHGDNLCIYTILIGNDEKGGAIMDQIAQSGECGLATDMQQLFDHNGIKDFVTEVFLAPDSDGDSIADARDLCPDTPPGVEVDENGCPKVMELAPLPVDPPDDIVVLDNVLFDFDKHVIKPEGFPIMDSIADILNSDRSLYIKIIGHTDYIGSDSYNDLLSVRRATAGKRYLEEKGIDSIRISTRGLGLMVPVASNTTRAGRALNRRIEFKFSRQPFPANQNEAEEATVKPLPTIRQSAAPKNSANNANSQKDLDKEATALRKEAASYFIKAQRATNPEEQKELLGKSWSLLNTISQEYPASEAAGRAKKNQADIEARIDSLFPGLLNELKGQ